jgi:hypothetical protein
MKNLALEKKIKTLATIAILASGTGTLTACDLPLVETKLPPALRNEEADLTSVEFQSASLEASEIIPTAYLETDAGLQLVLEEYGVSKPELDFVKHFRRPFLTDLSDSFDWDDGEKLYEVIRTQLLEDFDRDREMLDEKLSLSDRQAQIAYAVLRVNGSIPNYRARSYVPENLESLVLGSSGNCSDYTIRLMIVLEAIGVKALLISIVTDTFPGHIVVDDYDPVEDISYILDANFNVVLMKKNSDGKGFLRQALTSHSRASFLEGYQAIAFPVLFASASAENPQSVDTVYDLNLLNGQRDDLEERWEEWLRKNMDELIDWWTNTPTNRPASLADFRKIELSSIPEEFDGSISYANTFREYLSLDYPDSTQ